jgi:hypothetical protein
MSRSSRRKAIRSFAQSIYEAVEPDLGGKVGILDWLRRKRKEPGVAAAGQEAKSAADAIARLSDLSDEERVAAAVDLLKSPGFQVRAAAARKVAALKIKAVGVWHELATALADDKQPVRLAAAKAFWQLDGASYAIRSLRDEHESPALMSRESALKGIRALMETAPEKVDFGELLRENWQDCPVLSEILTLALSGSDEGLLKLIKMLVEAANSGDTDQIRKIQSVLEKHVDRRRFVRAVRTLPMTEQVAILGAVRPEPRKVGGGGVDELVSLCTEVNTNYQRMPYAQAQEAQRKLEVRIKEIGQQLFDKGGLKLMLEVHAQVARRCTYGRYLEGAWGGVGSWRG